MTKLWVLFWGFAGVLHRTKQIDEIKLKLGRIVQSDFSKHTQKVLGTQLS